MFACRRRLCDSKELFGCGLMEAPGRRSGVGRELFCEKASQSLRSGAFAPESELTRSDGITEILGTRHASNLDCSRNVNSDRRME